MLLLFTITEFLMYLSSEPVRSEIVMVNSLVFPRFVWMYYEGNLSKSIERMVTITLSTLQKRWIVTLLNATTLSQYLPVEEFPSTFPLLSSQLKSDVIRLALLERYGGWWIDVTSIVANDSFMEDARERCIQTKSHLFGYCFTECSRRQVESNFLYAPLHSVIIKVWNKEIQNALLQGTTNYMYNVHRSGVGLPGGLFVPYPKIEPYFLVYATEQVALDTHYPRCPILVDRAITQIYKLQYDCKWNRTCLRSSMNNELVEPRYAATKISHAYRQLFWGEKVPQSQSTVQRDPEQSMGIQLFWTDYIVLLKDIEYVIISVTVTLWLLLVGRNSKKGDHSTLRE